MSVLSFVKIVAAIRVSHKLSKYRENKGLNLRMPNYSVKMGFGLHLGWSIEGAIGSFYKIDASYLSPNMASRLEAATKQFGVPMLISGQLYEVMTPRAQTYLRKIDVVTVKGSDVPLELYTVDVEFGMLQVEQQQNLKKKDAKLRRVKARMARDRFKARAFDGQIQVSSKFETDKDIKTMRSVYNQVYSIYFIKIEIL